MTSAFFSIQDGELVHKSTIRKTFEGLKDGHYELVITKKNKRSIQQNRYYFGVCVKMVRDVFIQRGYDVSISEIHDLLKAKFNYLEVINYSSGEVDRIPRSTIDLNKDDFAIYIERIQRYAAESLDLVIPDPGEQMMIEYE